MNWGNNQKVSLIDLFLLAVTLLFCVEIVRMVVKAIRWFVA